MAAAVKFTLLGLVLLVVATNFTLESKCQQYSGSCKWSIKVQ